MSGWRRLLLCKLAHRVSAIQPDRRNIFYLHQWSKRLTYTLLLDSTSTTPTRTTSSPSSSTSPSPTSTGYSFPNWIRPAKNNQECDIYGPLCQTGSITVAVNLTSTTSPTVVPCSSYLSAQAYSMAGAAFLDHYRIYVGDEDYSSSFGRSPQCTSYAAAVGAKEWATTPSMTTLSYPRCDNSSGTLDIPEWYLPPGVLGHHMAQEYRCCGPCQLDIREIQIVYFPEGDANKTCSNGFNGTVARRAEPTGVITSKALPTSVVTFVSDGYT